MPNTLVHIALQVPAGYFTGRRASVPWVLLGCIIPDLPWIIRRVVQLLAPGQYSFEVIQYATVQASLLFCLIISAGVACLARRWAYVMIILALNCVIHLLIDAVEIKPGNGVHFFAPWSWSAFNFGWLWPENAIVTALTGVGICVALWALVSLSPDRSLWNYSAVSRKILFCGALLTYLIGPIALIQGPFDANIQSIKTLQEKDQRVGRQVTFDRRPYLIEDDAGYIVTAAGEKLRLIGPTLPRAGRASVTGVFVSGKEIEVLEIHSSQRFLRDIASLTGLLVVLLVWLKILLKRRFL
jgi:hypothetical protein